MKLLLSLCLALASLPSMPLAAQEPENSSVAGQEQALAERARDVVAVLKGETDPAEVFSSEFLAAVRPEQLQALTAQMTTQFGALVGVESVAFRESAPHVIALRFERAIARGTIALGPLPGAKVSGLLLNAFEPVGDSPAKIRADLGALPGTVSALFAPLEEGAEPLFSHQPDQSLAIGSTFKLYVLSALADRIAAGEMAWDDVVPLTVRSFPSGQMQDWPRGAPVTVQTLATMMISISDNTATDQLVALLGRERVEAELRAAGHSDPTRTLPLLTTLEIFALKGSPPNLAKYVAADEAGRRAMLRDFADDVEGDPARVTAPTFTEPTAIDTVEWFASAADLRALLRWMVAHGDETMLDVLGVNPSLPPSVRQEWQRIGFKGGSEPGVLNLTWLLQDHAGNWHVLSLGWNDPAAPVDKQTLELLALRILVLPRLGG